MLYMKETLIDDRYIQLFYEYDNETASSLFKFLNHRIGILVVKKRKVVSNFFKAVICCNISVAFIQPPTQVLLTAPLPYE